MTVKEEVYIEMALKYKIECLNTPWYRFGELNRLKLKWEETKQRIIDSKVSEISMLDGSSPKKPKVYFELEEYYEDGKIFEEEDLVLDKYVAMSRLESMKKIYENVYDNIPWWEFSKKRKAKELLDNTVDYIERRNKATR